MQFIVKVGVDVFSLDLELKYNPIKLTNQLLLLFPTSFISMILVKPNSNFISVCLLYNFNPRSSEENDRVSNFSQMLPRRSIMKNDIKQITQ